MFTGFHPFKENYAKILDNENVNSREVSALSSTTTEISIT